MISSQGALLAGFAVGPLTMSFDPSPGGITNPGQWQEFFTVVPAGISTAFNLLAVITATFATIYGPGLALCGEKGSMERYACDMRCCF